MAEMRIFEIEEQRWDTWEELADRLDVSYQLIGDCRKDVYHVRISQADWEIVESEWYQDDKAWLRRIEAKVDKALAILEEMRE